MLVKNFHDGQQHIASYVYDGQHKDLDRENYYRKRTTLSQRFLEKCNSAEIRSVEIALLKSENERSLCFLENPCCRGYMHAVGNNELWSEAEVGWSFVAETGMR